MKTKVLFFGALLAASLGTIGVSEGMNQQQTGENPQGMSSENQMRAKIVAWFDVNPNPTPENNRFFPNPDFSPAETANWWNALPEKVRNIMFSAPHNVCLGISSLCGFNVIDDSNSSIKITLVGFDLLSKLVEELASIHYFYISHSEKNISDEEASALNKSVNFVCRAVGDVPQFKKINVELLSQELAIYSQLMGCILRWVNNMESQCKCLVGHEAFWSGLKKTYTVENEKITWVNKTLSEFLLKKAHEFNGLLLFEVLFQLQTVRVFPINEQEEINDKAWELFNKRSRLQSESEAFMCKQEVDWLLFLSAVYVCFLYFKYPESRPEIKSIFSSNFRELSGINSDRVKQVVSVFPELFPKEYSRDILRSMLANPQ